MEAELDEFAPCEEELYVVDDSLEPVPAILTYSRSQLPAQRHAYVKGIAAAAPTASSDEVQQLLELVQELWEQPPDEDVQLEVVRQLPGLGHASSAGATVGESLQRLAMAAFEHYVLEGSEEGVAAAVEALAGLLPHLPVADAWNCLQRLAQPLAQQACGSEASEPCIARLTALRRCAEVLLQAYASPGTDEGGAEGCAEQAGQEQAQAERPQAQTGPLIDASTDAGRLTHAQPELRSSLTASEYAAWQQRAASLVVPALEFCTTHSDFAVQQATAIQLPGLLRLVPPATARALALRLTEQLAQHSNWKVRAAVASALPDVVAALAQPFSSTSAPGCSGALAGGSTAATRVGIEAEASAADGQVRQNGSSAAGSTEAGGSGAEADEAGCGALQAQVQLARLLVEHLATDSSQWVRSAAQCASGPLLCAMPAAWPAAAASDEADSQLTSQSSPAAADRQLPSPQTQRELAVQLVRSFGDAVLAPRPPPAEALLQLAGCLGSVCRRAMPTLISLHASQLGPVCRQLLSNSDAGVASAAVAALPDLAAAAFRPQPGGSTTPGTASQPAAAAPGGTAAAGAAGAGAGAGADAGAGAGQDAGYGQLLLQDLLSAVLRRVKELGPELAAVLLPLAQALPASQQRRALLLPLLPQLCAVPTEEPADADGPSHRQSLCGHWRVRLATAEQLAGLLACMGAGQGQGDEEGAGEARQAVMACLQTLQRDPVWRVRQEAARQVEQLLPPAA